MCSDTKRIHDFLVANHDGDPDDIGRMKDCVGASMYIVKRNGILIPIICLPKEFDLRNSFDYSLIAHESLHTAITMHRIREVKLPKNGNPMMNDEEGLCYLMQWIMNEFIDFVKNKDKHKFKFNDEILIKK